MRHITLVIGLLSLVTCNCVSAQVIQQVNQIRVGGAGMLGMDDEDLDIAMRVEIDAIRRVTGISEAAVKKLDVASKSAISAIKKKNEQEAQGVRRPVNPKAPATGGGLSDEDVERKEPEGIVNVPMLVRQFGTTIESVKNQEIWRKTIANVLDDEQQKKYDKYLADRQARNRAQAVGNYVDQLDSYLMLEDSQRAAIIKIVDREIGETLSKQRSIHRIGLAAVVMMGKGNKSSLSPDDLSEILSPVQLAEMKRQQDMEAQGPLNILGPKVAKPAQENAKLYQSSLGFGIAEESGKLIIREVKPDTPAEQAGVQVGDAIDSFDDMPVDTLVQLKRAISKSEKKWSMQVRRQDKLLTVGVSP